MYPHTVPAGWTVNNRWDNEIIPQLQALLAEEQKQIQHMDAMRSRIAYITEHEDECSMMDWAEREQLCKELTEAGYALATWMQTHLKSLELAGRLGLKVRVCTHCAGFVDVDCRCEG